jgi:hypothetical protein
MLSKGLRFLTLILLCSLASLVALQPAVAQVNERYFPETGHYVRGDFLDFYQNNPESLLLYGYPITDAFPRAEDGLIIQYFERARFELHPGAPNGLRVKLSPLGYYLHDSGPPLPLPKNFPPCKKFPGIEFQVCYAFLDFFNEHGGVEQFGYPDSNFELRDERIVQYFQNARFEWHPEMPPGQRVTLTNVGTRYFEGHESQKRKERAIDGPQVIQSLQVRVFPQDAISPLKGQQTVTVLVRDQNQDAVANAQVVFTVRLPNGQKMVLPTEVPTDGNGLAEVTFTYESDAPGIIQVWAEASLGNYKASSRSSFRVW